MKKDRFLGQFFLFLVNPRHLGYVLEIVIFIYILAYSFWINLFFHEDLSPFFFSNVIDPNIRLYLRFIFPLSFIFVVLCWIGSAFFAYLEKKNSKIQLKKSSNLAGLFSLVLFLVLLIPKGFISSRYIYIFFLALSISFYLTMTFLRSFSSLGFNKFFSPLINFWQRRELLIFIIVVSLIVGAWILFSIGELNHFRRPACDYGLFNQLLWRYSQFKSPIVTVRFTRNLLGEHADFIMFFLTPFLWLFKSPHTLALINVLVISLGTIPIYLLSKRILKSSFASLVLSFSYLTFIGIQYALDFEFHPITLSLSFYLFAFYFLFRKRPLPYFIFLFLALICKESVALYVIFLGLFSFYFLKERKIGLITCGLGICWYIGMIKFLIPSFHFVPETGVVGFCDPGSAIVKGYLYFDYSSLGVNEWSSLKTILVNPLFVFRTLFVPSIKLETLLALFGSVGFLPLFGLNYLFLAIPMLSEKFLSDRELLWGLHFHYSASLTPVFILAIIFGLKNFYLRFKKFLRKLTLDFIRWIIAMSVFLLVFSFFVNFASSPRPPITKLFKKDFWRYSPAEQAGREAIKLVPQNASVTAQNSIVPFLSFRDYIDMFPCGLEKAEYILLSSELDAWPFDKEEIKEKIEKLSRTHTIVFQKEGTTLFKKRD